MDRRKEGGTKGCRYRGREGGRGRYMSGKKDIEQKKGAMHRKGEREREGERYVREGAGWREVRQSRHQRVRGR